jgi:hypothetical protein
MIGQIYYLKKVYALRALMKVYPSIITRLVMKGYILC